MSRPKLRHEVMRPRLVPGAFICLSAVASMLVAAALITVCIAAARLARDDSEHEQQWRFRLLEQEISALAQWSISRASP